MSTDTLGYVSVKLVEAGDAPDLMLMAYDWDAGTLYSSAKIVGSVLNTTPRTMSYVQISWTLFDAQGRQVGTAWDDATNLAPGGVWRFGALILADNAASYRLGELSGH